MKAHGSTLFILRCYNFEKVSINDCLVTKKSFTRNQIREMNNLEERKTIPKMSTGTGAQVTWAEPFRGDFTCTVEMHAQMIRDESKLNLGRIMRQGRQKTQGTNVNCASEKY